MKRTLLAAALCLSTQVQAFDLPFQPDNWSKGDTVRQLLYTGIAIVDAGQTADIRNHDDVHENNILTRNVLGDNPEKGETAAYFAGVIVVNYAVSRVLPPKWRQVWQYSTITLNAAVVGSNYELGLRWGF